MLALDWKDGKETRGRPTIPGRPTKASAGTKMLVTQAQAIEWTPDKPRHETARDFIIAKRKKGHSMEGIANAIRPVFLEQKPESLQMS